MKLPVTCGGALIKGHQCFLRMAFQVRAAVVADSGVHLCRGKRLPLSAPDSAKSIRPFFAPERTGGSDLAELYRQFSKEKESGDF